MITLDCGRDMEILGIDWLTGEACAYSQRILVGLTQFGADLVCDFYGIQPSGLREPWNSRACGQTAVASFMLPSAFEQNTALCVVGLFKRGCSTVYFPRKHKLPPLVGQDAFDAESLTPEEQTWSGMLIGVRPEDDSRYGETVPVSYRGDVYSANIRCVRVIHNPGFSRNRHAMTGRVE